MAHLIDKAAVVAEIDRRIKVLQEHPYENHKTICHLDSLKQSLDTLEVKEVDLEKEIEKEIEKEWLNCDLCRENTILEYVNMDIKKFRTIVNHFFEFGLKAQKGE